MCLDEYRSLLPMVHFVKLDALEVAQLQSLVWGEEPAGEAPPAELEPATP